MAAGPRTVWGIVTSRAIRAHWALHELGLDYRTEPIRARTPSMQDPRFRAVSPRGKIPVLQDGDLTLGESAAIVTYLGESYRSLDTDLVPETPAARARYNEWCSVVMMEIDATSLYIIRRHGDLHETYGKAPEAVEGARRYFDRPIGAVGRQLDDGRPYLLGDAFSGADILLTSCLTWAARYGLPVPASVDAYRERMTVRPAYTAARAVCYPPEVARPATGGHA